MAASRNAQFFQPLPLRFQTQQQGVFNPRPNHDSKYGYTVLKKNCFFQWLKCSARENNQPRRFHPLAAMHAVKEKLISTDI